MVGRPKEFDEKTALQRAMEVFWAHGYEATSVQDLLDAMGINRGSMYDTFGDKHALFGKAIDHYGGTVLRGLEDALDASGSPLGNVRKVLRQMVDRALTGDDRGCGCMATQTAVELAPHDAGVARTVRELLARIEKAFHRTIGRAVEAGELSPDVNVRALARFFTGTIQGLVVMGKAAPGKATLNDIVDTALSVLDR